MPTEANPNETIVGDYRVIEDKAHNLGSGSYGTVYRAEHVTDEKRTVAAKKTQVEKQFSEDKEVKKEIELEAILLKKIPPHENIIKVYDLIKTESVEKGIDMIDIWLIMEYAPLGNLKEFAKKNKLTIEQKVKLMFQCAVGLKHLHDCKPEPIAHRDIKPENIVITGSVDDPVARICDFGAGKAVLQRSGRSVPMMTHTGTPYYAAPEQTPLHEGNLSYDKLVDIFSLGVTFETLLRSSEGKVMTPRTLDGTSIGKAMWEFKRTMSESSKLFNVTSFSLNIDDPSDSPLEKAIKDIIKRMIQLEPSDRMPISEVVARLSELRVSTPKLIAVNERSVWVMKGSTWEELPDIPPELGDYEICYCIVPDGIVALGGWKDGTASSVCYHFSLLERRWKKLADMPTARFWASAVAIRDMLLVLGGWDNEERELAECVKLRINDDNGQWSPAASMTNPLGWLLVASVAGKVFVLPQSSTISPGTQLQQYDPDTGEFSEVASLPPQVNNTYGACLVGAGDKMYLLGGEQRLALQHSPATGGWEELPQPSACYDSGCSGVMLGDKLLLCGGSSDGNAGNMVEEYDPQTKQWETSDIVLPFEFGWHESLVGTIHV